MHLGTRTTRMSDRRPEREEARLPAKGSQDCENHPPLETSGRAPLYVQTDATNLPVSVQRRWIQAVLSSRLSRIPLFSLPLG